MLTSSCVLFLLFSGTFRAVSPQSFCFPTLWMCIVRFLGREPYLLPERWPFSILALDSFGATSIFLCQLLILLFVAIVMFFI